MVLAASFVALHVGIAAPASLGRHRAARGDRLPAGARAAFVDGVHAAALTGAITMTLTAILAARALRETSSGPDEARAR